MTYTVSYTTVDNLKSAFPAISSYSTVTSAQLYNNIGKAEAEINMYLGTTYGLPFTASIPVLQSFAEDIAIFYIMRRLYTAQDKAPKPWWMQSYEDTIKKLIDIRDKKTFLITSSGGVLEPSAGSSIIWSNKENYIPTFDERNDIFQHVDSTKLEDQNNSDISINSGLD